VNRYYPLQKNAFKKNFLVSQESVLAAIFSAASEIAQVARNHGESPYESKDRFPIALSGKSSDQKKTKSQRPQHDPIEILMTSTAKKYGNDTCGNNEQKHQLVKNFFG